MGKTRHLPDLLGNYLWIYGYGFKQVRVWVALGCPKGYPCICLELRLMS